MLNQVEAFTILYALTPTKLKILVTLCHQKKRQDEKEILSIFPSRKTIAKWSGCSEESVKKFLQFFRKIGLPGVEIAERWDRVKGKNLSNVYHVDDVLYKMVALISDLGWIKKWRTKKVEVARELDADPTYLQRCFETRKRQFLKGKSTSYEHIRTPSPPSNIPTIKDSIKEARYRISERDRASAQLSGQKILMNPILPFIEIQGLNREAIAHADRHASKEVLRRVNLSYRYKKDRNQEIYDPSKWFVAAVDSELLFSAKMIMNRRK